MTHSSDWQALDVVLTDRLVKADAAYLVGETRDNARSVLERGAKLLQSGIVPCIAIQKGGDGYGYCGFEYSVATMKNFGVPEERIIGIEYGFEFGEKVINTQTELITTVRYARTHGWRNLLLVAPEFHLRRSFLTAVTVVDQEYPELKVYSHVGTALPEDERVVHSQGTLEGTRKEFVFAEDKRIAAYQKDSKPYRLVSVDRALEYIAKRDAS